MRRSTQFGPMQSAPYDATLDAMAGAIVAAVHPACVLLFGSRATGTARPDSDVDLLIVAELDAANGWSRRHLLSRARQSVAQFDLATDLLVFSPAEVERWRESPYHVVGHALRQGKVLYARP